MTCETPDAGPPGTASALESVESAAAVARVAGYGPLGDRLEATETRLADAVSSPPDLLGEAAAHLMSAGGKRVRPALTLLFADLFVPAGTGSTVSERIHTRAVEAGVACELVHLGSLYHDDVIDEAATRRGVTTVNTNWSNTVAVLSGDFLLACASQIAASLGAEPARILAWAIGQLVEGEVLELQQLFDTRTTVETYFEVIDGKTASLMGTSCRLGALMAETTPEQVEVAYEFGSELGLVFQIVDDILDLVADEEQTGKRRGIDLVEGVYTLPILLALQSDDGQLRSLLHPGLDRDEIEHVIDLTIKRGGVAAAVDEAAKRLARCDALLDSLPDGEPVEALSRLSRYVISRVPDGI